MNNTERYCRSLVAFYLTFCVLLLGALQYVAAAMSNAVGADLIFMAVMKFFIPCVTMAVCRMCQKDASVR